MSVVVPQFEILLPSNKAWRMKNYYKLVEQQRALDANPMPAVLPPEKGQEKWRTSPQPEAKRPRRSSASMDSGLSLTSTLSIDTTWTATDITKAGCLLTRPPRPTSFEDEEEMRRVYSLIYDVFRYKSVLNQALLDTAFFIRYPKFQKQANLVWLLFYDLYKRRFLPRDQHEEHIRKQLFEEAGLQEAEQTLWHLRVKLAASVARLRIKNNALKLSQLLPLHLRDERVVALDEAPVTGWINTFKIDTDEVTEMLQKAGLTPVESAGQKLQVLNYECDEVCPKFIKCHPTQRSDLAQSTLVKRHHIVLQDRAFGLGPAIMSCILQDLELSGNVVQTHINSPRTMAYLANILADNENVEILIAFGAGERKEEYEEYLRDLGVTNTEVYAERFVDLPSESAVLENVVAVLATPPNTYSGVIDPVDLVCSRGGDLSMLEVLTATEIGGGSLERVNRILEEQRQTLRISMSRPQIQVVLYETHSIVPAENSEMVTRLVNEMNNNALEKHAEEQGKPIMSPSMSSKRDESETSPVVGGESFMATSSSAISYDTLDAKDAERISYADSYSDIMVPPCDIFELNNIPDLNPEGEGCLCLEKEGCYLAYLRRKEIVRLNAKYMIEIAESRGLFGGDGGSKEGKKSASGRQQRKKPELSRSMSGSPPLTRPKGRRFKFEVDRIAAPTHASLLRRVTDRSAANQDGSLPSTICCLRHQNHIQQESTATVGINAKVAAQMRRKDARRWWAEAAKHIMTFGLNAEFGQDRTDDPPKPSLRLTRTRPDGRVPFPVNVTSIQFDEPQECLAPLSQCFMT